VTPKPVVECTESAGRAEATDEQEIRRRQCPECELLRAELAEAQKKLNALATLFENIQPVQ